MVPKLPHYQTIVQGHGNIVVRTVNINPLRTAGLNFRSHALRLLDE